MIKYIIKRLVISIFILLGVSIIIYSLVRMMPNDYIDLKYAEAIAQGQVTQDDVQNLRKFME